MTPRELLAHLIRELVPIRTEFDSIGLGEIKGVEAKFIGTFYQLTTGWGGAVRIFFYRSHDGRIFHIEKVGKGVKKFYQQNLWVEGECEGDCLY